MDGETFFGEDIEGFVKTRLGGGGLNGEGETIWSRLGGGGRSEEGSGGATLSRLGGGGGGYPNEDSGEMTPSRLGGGGGSRI